ncbi:sulfotransferase family protein [Salinibacter ruber]|uniref:sulfotransferase family protein n=1 Tax=Salinibacter ruber TaxID=146919 RepID=UPI0021673AA8|nr:sulfotransferase family protein [Salinibacter ruber]MCS4199740.1 hypothetical protein [Salinibacter ruber]
MIGRYIGALVRRLPFPFGKLTEVVKRRRLQDSVKRKGGDVRGKVFGIGLSRTATTSLSEALSILGYETADWKRGERVIGWPEYFLADAATDTPVASRFESLYFTFEESKFIYTTRDIDGWVSSMKRYFGAESPSESGVDWRVDERWGGISDWGWYNTFRRAQIHQCLYGGHDSWEEAYKAHDRRIRHFFENKPADRFLVLDIPDGDGWAKLCEFLNVPVPSHPFPHENQSA